MSADVAKPIGVLVLNHFTNTLSTMLVEPGECLVKVVDREHDTQVSKSVHRGGPVICDSRWAEKARDLEPAMAIGCDHHSDLDAL